MGHLRSGRPSGRPKGYRPPEAKRRAESRSAENERRLRGELDALRNGRILPGPFAPELAREIARAGGRTRLHLGEENPENGAIYFETWITFDRARVLRKVSKPTK